MIGQRSHAVRPVWAPTSRNPFHVEVYRFLIDYYLYQDGLSWSRTQILLGVEAGTLAAAFSQKGVIGAIALVLGTFLVVLLWGLVERDWEVRDQHLSIIDQVHWPKGIRMTLPPTGWWWKGKDALHFTFWLIISVNAAFYALLMWCTSWGKSSCGCSDFGL